MGSSDDLIRDHARQVEQAIITQDRGMIRQCVEYRQPVIWIDRKGRKSVLEEAVKMTILVLRSVPKWEELLNGESAPDIIRTTTRGTNALTIEEFSDITEHRTRYSSPAKRIMKLQKLTKVDEGCENESADCK